MIYTFVYFGTIFVMLVGIDIDMWLKYFGYEQWIIDHLRAMVQWFETATPDAQLLVDDGQGYGTVGGDVRFDPDDPIYYKWTPVAVPDDKVAPTPPPDNITPKPAVPVAPTPKPPTPVPKPTVCRSRGFYRDGIYHTDEQDDNDNTVVPTDVVPSDATIIAPGERTDP